ncbi:MAG: hypothetical protein ABFC62_10350 [Clostridiaceae bacterium]
MEIIANEKDRILEIWLTNAEKNDAVLRASLKPLYSQWKAKKYLPVVYESGSGDLKESILGLLQHNREVIAKREMAEEKRHKHTLGIIR